MIEPRRLIRSHRSVGLVLLLLVASRTALAQSSTMERPEAPVIALEEAAANAPEMIQSDGKLHLEFGKERVILPRGLQPSLLCTSSGALVVQAQIPEKPVLRQRMSYPSALATVISRDGGTSWARIPLKPGENGLNMEGGAIQLKDGTILALDTYVTPGDQPDLGVGQVYTSTDDWQTLQGPLDVLFKLPNVNFYASRDDGGRPHVAVRLHRRILELPNGDLIATIYGCLHGDNTPCPYQPKMMKGRMMFVRSSDRGKSWRMISNLAVAPDVGTEGFGEPVICRVSKGPHAGRIICWSRTGRNLYQTISDDEGQTWTPAAELILAGLDVNQWKLWIDQFRQFEDFKGRLLDENNLDEVRGAVVDPDMVELRGSGILVAAFGVRIPQKQCWNHPEHPWNGNYLAFSFDHGQTWSNVVRITSGRLTTHYMAIQETPTNGELYLCYDLGGWGKGMRRDVIGRTFTVATVTPASGQPGSIGAGSAKASTQP